MPIRVRLFHTRYHHWGRYTGLYQVARHVDPAVCRMWLTPVSDGDDDWPVPWPWLNGHVRRRITRRGMAWYKLSDLAAELRALPACLASALDVAHFIDGEHTGQYLPRLIKRSRISRVKTIATFHQPPELLDGLISREIVSDVDLVLLVSATQESYFRQFLPDERIRTVLHGVDTEFFRPGPRPPADGVFRCVTVGHWLRDWDAMHRVVRAAAWRNDLEFHVVTGRPTGLEGLPHVTFHASVDDETLRRLYQRADALLLPLTGSTANNSLLEGMACGLPVISTRLPSIEAYVNGSSAVLIDANDAGSLLDAVAHLMRTPDLRERMGRCSRARAEELAWPRVARRWEEMYAHLLGRRVAAIPGPP